MRVGAPTKKAANLMKVNGLDTLMPGGQVKVKEAGASNRISISALRKYLRGLPSLEFSEKGQANICQRFGVSTEELNAALDALRPAAEGSRPC